MSATLPFAMMIVMLVIGALIWRGESYGIWLPRTIVALCIFMLAGSISEGLWRHNEVVGTQMVKVASGNDEGFLTCNRPTGEVLHKQPSENIQGWVWQSKPNEANIRYRVCLELQSWLWSDKLNPSESQSIAVGIVIHEAQHVGGTWEESAAECQTIDKYAEVVEKFGVKPKVAESMAEAYAIDNEDRAGDYLCATDRYTD